MPPELNDRLADLLLKRFEGNDDGLGILSRIEGVPAQVRRAVPQLVRVPIRWCGETKKALALRLFLRLFVEEEGTAAEWRVPPWGAAETRAPAGR